MKKKMILDLIKYHEEKNENEFRRTAYEVAKDFNQSGDYTLSEYIMGLLTPVNTLSLQANESNLTFFSKVKLTSSVLPVPECIRNDLIGVGNAILNKTGVHKFLFQGVPGTGKTESVKQLAKLLGMDLFELDASQIIDSRLGQTAKNVKKLFEEMNTYPLSKHTIFLFDEIDSLALDRVNDRDVREMGRATSALLKGLDDLREDVVLIATTNLYQMFDKALSRRFDAVVDFNRYTRQDLEDVAEGLLNDQISKYPGMKKDCRLFRKIVKLPKTLPMPGEMKNVIRTSLAFSLPGSETGYLSRLFSAFCPDLKKMNAEDLRKAGFTVRQIGILKNVSKSSVARQIGGE